MSAEREQGGTEATTPEAAALLTILFADRIGDKVRALRAYAAEKTRVYEGVMAKAHPRDAHCACDWCKLAYNRTDMPNQEQTREALT